MLPSLLLPLWDSEMGRDSSPPCDRFSPAVKLRSFARSSRRSSPKEVGSRVDDPPGSGPIRVQFVASQLVGVVMARYILELDPFKSRRSSRSPRPSPPTCSATSPVICRIPLMPARATARARPHRPRAGLVDQQHRNTVLDGRRAEPGVVETLAPNNNSGPDPRADQDSELFVEHERASAEWGRPCCWCRAGSWVRAGDGARLVAGQLALRLQFFALRLLASSFSASSTSGVGSGGAPSAVPRSPELERIRRLEAAERVFSGRRIRSAPTAGDVITEGVDLAAMIASACVGGHRPDPRVSLSGQSAFGGRSSGVGCGRHPIWRSRSGRQSRPAG